MRKSLYRRVLCYAHLCPFSVHSTRTELWSECTLHCGRGTDPVLLPDSRHHLRSSLLSQMMLFEHAGQKERAARCRMEMDYLDDEMARDTRPKS